MSVPTAEAEALRRFEADGRPARGPIQRGMSLVARLPAFWYATSLFLVLALWQIVVFATETPDYILPTPAQVAEAFVTYRGVLVEHGWVTVSGTVLAFGASALLGVAIAIPIAFIKVVERLVYPLLAMSQAVPKIALGPLFIVWFGFGFRTNVLIAISVTVFPIIVNTVLGLRDIDPEVVRLGRSMGGSRLRIFWHLRVPTALPGLFAGLKIGVTLAVIGVVVGEFIVGGAGLGYLTLAASGNQNVALLFTALISLALVGIVSLAAVELLERTVLRRHPSRH